MSATSSQAASQTNRTSSVCRPHCRQNKHTHTKNTQCTICCQSQTGNVLQHLDLHLSLLKRGSWWLILMCFSNQTTEAAADALWLAGWLLATLPQYMCVSVRQLSQRDSVNLCGRVYRFVLSHRLLMICIRVGVELSIKPPPPLTTKAQKCFTSSTLLKLLAKRCPGGTHTHTYQHIRKHTRTHSHTSHLPAHTHSYLTLNPVHSSVTALTNMARHWMSAFLCLLFVRLQDQIQGPKQPIQVLGPGPSPGPIHVLLKSFHIPAGVEKSPHPQQRTKKGHKDPHSPTWGSNVLKSPRVSQIILLAPHRLSLFPNPLLPPAQGVCQ